MELLPNDIRLIIYGLVRDSLYDVVINQFRNNFMVYWDDHSNTFSFDGLWLIVQKSKHRNGGVNFVNHIFNIPRLIKHRTKIQDWNTRIEYGGVCVLPINY